MIITCPACQAQYILPDDAIGAKGRRVKCTSCAYTWLQPSPEQETTEKEQDFSDFIEVGVASPRAMPVPRSPITPVKTSEDVTRPVMLGAILGLGLTVITIGFMVMMRQGLVPEWPPMAFLYEKLGVAVPAPGTHIALENVTTTLIPEDKPEKMQIKGKIVNNTKENKSLPSLLIRANGAKGWLKDWHIDLYGKALMAQQSINFEYVLKDIPQNITEITVRFTE